MIKEVKGLVIRTTDIRESDRLITIFTEEEGVLSAMAQGARSLKSRKMSSTMQFCYSRFILYKKGEYYYVREAELIESFFDLRNSIEGLALAAYIADVLSDVTVAAEEKELKELYLSAISNTGKDTHTMYKTIHQLGDAGIRLLNKKARVGWTSHSHTAHAVPVFAIGVGAERFSGWYDNTEIVPLIRKAIE